MEIFLTLIALVVGFGWPIIMLRAVSVAQERCDGILRTYEADLDRIMKRIRALEYKVAAMSDKITEFPPRPFQAP